MIDFTDIEEIRNKIANTTSAALALSEATDLTYYPAKHFAGAATLIHDELSRIAEELDALVAGAVVEA